MLLSSAIPSNSTSTLLLSPISPKLPSTTTSIKPSSSSSSSYRPTPAFSASSPQTIRHVNHTPSSDGDPDPTSMVPSASAVASTSPVDFMQRIENHPQNGIVLPSPDFQRLCIQQLDLFRRIVHPDALLSVYVRPAGSYVMDRLELRRVTGYPGVNASDIVILVGSFSVTTGFRASEAVLSNHKVEVIAECNAMVFPMVKHPFVVGFLVAELPRMEMSPPGSVGSERCDLIPSPTPEEVYASLQGSDVNSWDDEAERVVTMYKFSAEQRSIAINISRSLAMAYVMDQKAMLLQQSLWQNNIRMSSLVEQIRGPLSSIRTLSKMLSMHTKRSEIYWYKAIK